MIFDPSGWRVEVYSRNGVRRGRIDLRYSSFEFTDVYNNVGEWKAKVPSGSAIALALQEPGAGIIARGPDGIQFSGPVDASEDIASSTDPEGVVTVTGVSDNIILADALCYPVPSSATMEGQGVADRDERTGPVETLMYAFVNANIGPGAPAARRKANLTLAPNQARGPVKTKGARFHQLGELLGELAPLADLGFRVTRSGVGPRFEVYAPRDRTQLIRMSVANNRLAAVSAIRAGATVTHAIVAGQGEGKDRQLVERTTAESIEQASLWGRRIERFIDQRHTDNVAELEGAGDKVLAEEGVERNVVRFTPMSEANMAYGRDWGLGDRVTAVVRGIPIPAVVTSVKVVIDSGGVRIACGLGDVNALDANAGMRQWQSSVESRLGTLERSTAAPSVEPDPHAGRLTGEIVPYAGTSAQPGYLLCNGAAYSRTGQAALFAVIGTTYGAGDGATTFNVPDLRGRFPLGASGSYSLGSAGGAATHVLTQAEMPSHTHTQNAHTHTLSNATVASSGHTHGVAGTAWALLRLSSAATRQIVQRRATVSGGWTSTHALTPSAVAAVGETNSETLGTDLSGNTGSPSATTTVSAQNATAVNQSTGGGQAHNNMPPYVALNYLIKT